VPPSVLHLSTYDANGGAGRAAYALHSAMLAAGVDSTMRVARQDKWATNTAPKVTEGSDLRFRAANRLDRQLWRLQHSPNDTWRSPARFGSLSADEINRSNADVVNLHWVTAGFLSIKEIGRITKPIIWSIYDMWPFSGTEHYGVSAPDARWRTGYTKTNRPKDERGVDIDLHAWVQKKELWRPSQVVTASSWMHDAVQVSALMREWPVSTIAHVIDCEMFQPTDMFAARNALGLPTDVPLILFLAGGGIHDPRKGWDLLEQALGKIKSTFPTVEVVIVGPIDETYRSPSGTKIHWRGNVSSNETLTLHYNAANVTVVPSREDNMPLTAMEAQSCGKPVVAFAIGGLNDIIDHNITGHLAEANNTDDLAQGIINAINDSQHDNTWGQRARARALETWSPETVVKQYLDVYARAQK
jgi:glycosyltransferase involved in cell wall biosynthesis